MTLYSVYLYTEDSFCAAPDNTNGDSPNYKVIKLMLFYTLFAIGVTYLYLIDMWSDHMDFTF